MFSSSRNSSSSAAGPLPASSLITTSVSAGAAARRTFGSPIVVGAATKSIRGIPGRRDPLPALAHREVERVGEVDGAIRTGRRALGLRRPRLVRVHADRVHQFAGRALEVEAEPVGRERLRHVGVAGHPDLRHRVDLAGLQDDAREVGLGSPDVAAQPLPAAPEHVPPAEVDRLVTPVAEFEESVRIRRSTAVGQLVDEDRGGGRHRRRRDDRCGRERRRSNDRGGEQDGKDGAGHGHRLAGRGYRCTSRRGVSGEHPGRQDAASLRSAALPRPRLYAIASAAMPTRKPVSATM